MSTHPTLPKWLKFANRRWGKVVEDRLHEDTFKLVNELQERLSLVEQV